jgi:hypothetical protein
LCFGDPSIGLVESIEGEGEGEGEGESLRRRARNFSRIAKPAAPEARASSWEIRL